MRVVVWRQVFYGVGMTFLLIDATANRFLPLSAKSRIFLPEAKSDINFLPQTKSAGIAKNITANSKMLT